ncbi:MAG: LacI family DNA-binding transcriptional regulator [Sphaerochaeta sp.]|jgi:DNA-binding LacI/PurR family transcriptional regulator|nr:LacI family transcriptional regulator [Sphaerochaeta sp.]MDX9915224.1 LacI family DNA-binding transcriptional regulator [Sphaerochaeta sp.]
MATKRITIEDIAREAGVGIGTVSRVLNNSPHVSEQTRQRVLDVMKARQYKPSGVASKLARQDGVETTIGLLLPDIGNHYFFEIFEAIYRKLRGLGIDLIIFNYEKHNPKIIQRVLDAQVSALLIFAFRLDETEHEMLRWRNVRYLYIDYPMEDEHTIYPDNVWGGTLAARYLIDKGCTRPLYIAVDPPAQANADRWHGFASELSKEGITEVGTVSCLLDEEIAYTLGKRIADEDQYDGIFCYCDDIAAGCIRAIREAGSAMRVIGFDGVRATGYLDLSTVSQEPARIGTTAATLIVQIMEAEEDPPLHIERFLPILIDRGS